MTWLAPETCGISWLGCMWPLVFQVEGPFKCQAQHSIFLKGFVLSNHLLPENDGVCIGPSPYLLNSTSAMSSLNPVEMHWEQMWSFMDVRRETKQTVDSRRGSWKGPDGLLSPQKGQDLEDRTGVLVLLFARGMGWVEVAQDYGYWNSWSLISLCLLRSRKFPAFSKSGLRPLATAHYKPKAGSAVQLPKFLTSTFRKAQNEVMHNLECGLLTSQPLHSFAPNDEQHQKVADTQRRFITINIGTHLLGVERRQAPGETCRREMERAVGSGWQQNKGPPARSRPGGEESPRTVATISRWQVLHLARRWREQPSNRGLNRPQMADCVQECLSERAEAWKGRPGRGLSHHGYKGVMHVHTKTHIQERGRVLARERPKEEGGKTGWEGGREGGREKGPRLLAGGWPRSLEFDSWAWYLGWVRPTFNTEVRLKEEKRLPGIAAPAVWEGSGSSAVWQL
ncbi:hypothetical protein L345_02063, partial [Ophiophagus hannah]